MGILFSGGIDCAVLAFLAHQLSHTYPAYLASSLTAPFFVRFIPPGEPIDLLNVAFENPRKIKAASAAHAQPPKNPKRSADHVPFVMPGSADIYGVPDRYTGLEQLEELQISCPGRRWNFVSMLISAEDSQLSTCLIGQGRHNVSGVTCTSAIFSLCAWSNLPCAVLFRNPPMLAPLLKTLCFPPIQSWTWYVTDYL